jgi:hypothetical protein
MSETELRLRTMRQGGIDLFDRQGRPRVPLGTGPEAELAKAIYHIRQRRVLSESRVLSSRDFLRLYKGVATANYNGWILNTFVTISWSLAGLTDPSAVRAAQASFQERLTSWFQYRRRADLNYPPLAAMWVKEVGQTMGLHTHYLIHVPENERSEFARWARSSVATATGSPRRAFRKTPRGQPMQVTVVQHVGRDFAGQWNVFRYMAKGMDPDILTNVIEPARRRVLTEEYLGLKDLSDEGTVVGQRCGRSKAISTKAFQEWCSDYENVMEGEWRSRGRRSYHYGHEFYMRGDSIRHFKKLSTFLNI